MSIFSKFEQKKINNNLFNLKTVFTDRDTQQGMMNKKFDDTFDGMLFLMKNHLVLVTL